MAEAGEQPAAGGNGQREEFALAALGGGREASAEDSETASGS